MTHVVSFHNQGQNCKKLDDGTFFLSGFEVLQGPNYALAQMMRCLIAWCSSWPCLVNADVDGSHVGLPENRLPIIAPECAVSSSCSKVETAMLGKKIHHFQTHPGHLRKEEPQHVGFPAPKSDESKTRFNDKNLLGPFAPMATKVNGERHFCTWRASLYLGPMGGGIWRYWGPSVANKYGGFNTERGEYLKTTWSPSQGSGDLGCINLSLRLHM